MVLETINGQCVGKANHYLSVPSKDNMRRIIKDAAIRNYEKSFIDQCKIYRNKRISSRFKLFCRVYHTSIRFDLDNALKTILDCLQMVGAITDDKFCFEITAVKAIDPYNPRVEFGIEEVNEQKNIFSNF